MAHVEVAARVVEVRNAPHPPEQATAEEDDHSLSNRAPGHHVPAEKAQVLHDQGSLVGRLAVDRVAVDPIRVKDLPPAIDQGKIDQRRETADHNQ
ncbi:MAG: hypothetical protein AAF664_02975 [Planctomycetota bacterium]